MKQGVLFFLSVLLIAGCQATPEAADADHSEMTMAPAEDVMGRPDAQNPGDGDTVPANWMVRLDNDDQEAVIGSNPDSSDIYFVNMKPGWHITTGPAGVFYHPASTASGIYEASADINLFDPGDRREAFGLIIGGQDLDAPNQSYDYFLIRNSGEFLIKRRRGGETETIQEWTASDAIKRYTDTTEASVLNQLSVRVGEEEVTFIINENEVATLPREELQTDGLFGLRVNHALNLHISDIAVMQAE